MTAATKQKLPRSAPILAGLRAVTSRLYLRGLPRLLYAARRGIFPGAGRRPIEVGGGIRLCLDPDEYFESMLIWNYYAPQLRAVVQRILRRGDVFIDVGANMGYFSTLGATLVGPSGRVIAIEPDPQALALLRANLELNASPIVDVLEAAAGGASGDLSFHVSSQLGWSSAISHAGMMVAQTISVPVVTIDAVVSDHLRGRTPRLLKADVEGFEPEVLRGAARLLSSSSTAFLLEVNTLGLRAGGSAFSDLFEVFSRHRYDVHWVHGQSGMVQALGSPRLERVTDPLDFAERDGDILALPAGWGRL